MTTVSGTIRDTQRNPVPGAVVVLKYTRPVIGFAGGAAVQNIRTFAANGAGVVTLTNLVPGEYEITISVPASTQGDLPLVIQRTRGIALDVAQMTLEQFLALPEFVPPVVLIPGPPGREGPRGPRGVDGPKGDAGNFFGFNLNGVVADAADLPSSATSDGQIWGVTGDGFTTIFYATGGAWQNLGSITPPTAFPVANTIFVQENGSNANSGSSLGTAVRHIERALELASQRPEGGLIEWYPERDVITQAHLDVPDNWAIVSRYRTVIVRPEPGFEERNLFRLGNGCFVEGVLSEGFRIDDPDMPTEGFFASFRPGAVIMRPPYVHKCAVRAIQPEGFVGPALDPLNGNPGWPLGPGAILADGLVCSQYSIFPNMLAWGLTPLGYNGAGYRARNGGLVHAVGAVGMWCHKHFVAESGGKMQLSGCETQFGDYSLVADGGRNVVRPRPMTAPLSAQAAAAAAIAAARQSIVDDMWADLVAGGFTTDWTAQDEAFTRFDADVWIRAIEHMLRGAASDPVERFQRVLFDVTGAKVYDLAKEPAFIRSFQRMRDTMQALSSVGADADAMITDATAKLIATLESPEFVFERSVVEAIGHKWTGQGAGVWAIKAPPILAKWTIEQSILQTNGGLVIATGQDSDGNAEFAGGVKIDARFGLGGRGFVSPVARIATRAAITFGGF